MLTNVLTVAALRGFVASVTRGWAAAAGRTGGLPAPTRLWSITDVNFSSCTTPRLPRPLPASSPAMLCVQRGGGARVSTTFSASLEGPPPVRTGRGSTGPASRRRTRRPRSCSRPCSRPGPSPSSPRHGTRARRSPARPRARRAPPPPARAPTRRATARCATSSPPRRPSPPPPPSRRARRPWFGVTSRNLVTFRRFCFGTAQSLLRAGSLLLGRTIHLRRQRTSLQSLASVGRAGLPARRPYLWRPVVC